MDQEGEDQATLPHDRRETGCRLLGINDQVGKRECLCGCACKGGVGVHESVWSQELDLQVLWHLWMTSHWSSWPSFAVGFHL